MAEGSRQKGEPQKAESLKQIQAKSCKPQASRNTPLSANDAVLCCAQDYYRLANVQLYLPLQGGWGANLYLKPETRLQLDAWSLQRLLGPGGKFTQDVEF
jgi:hypothetical protein